MRRPFEPLIPDEGVPRASLRKRLLVSAVVVVVPLALLEVGLALLIQLPPSKPAVVDAIRAYYARHVRAIVQYDPQGARHDPEVSYLLQPGTFNFSNLEFDVPVHANTAGLRDDEASLVQPQVIVVGDSHGFGWGVEQEQTLAQVMERMLGVRVLNACMSSFATVRSMRLLGRLDCSDLRCLVVQYCPNDLGENRAFVNHPEQFRTVSRSGYEERVAKHARTRRYWPGKLIVHLLPRVANRLAEGPRRKAPASAQDLAQEAAFFLAVLGPVLRDMPAHLQVVVFECNTYGHIRPGFTEQLSIQLARTEHAAYADRVHPFDASRCVDLADFYLIDGHPRASAHAKLAAAIAELIRPALR